MNTSYYRYCNNQANALLLDVHSVKGNMNCNYFASNKNHPANQKNLKKKKKLIAFRLDGFPNC